MNSLGLGVQIWTYALENEIAYSDISFALEQCELEVVNASSFAINNKVYHTIHAKVVGANSKSPWLRFLQQGRLLICFSDDTEDRGPTRLSVNCQQGFHICQIRSLQP